MCQILHMKIYYKRSNGNWKLYEPLAGRSNEKSKRLSLQPFGLDESAEKKKHSDYLNECIIYLQELRVDNTANKTSGCKIVRILLNKKLWLSKHAYNSKICMNFSQFNDADELKAYQKPFFSIESNKITDLFIKSIELNWMNKLYCVFVSCVPPHLLLNTECSCLSGLTDLEFTQEFNTIGKQLVRFQPQGKDKIYQYLNHLWGKTLFTDEFVSFKYSLILEQ